MMTANDERPRATPTELLTAMEARIAIGQPAPGLLRLQADLLPEGDPEAAALREQADRAASDLLAWRLAAQCLREAIKLRAETESMLTGWPAPPDRPDLRVVDGDGAAHRA